jgi:hypothetical protein
VSFQELEDFVVGLSGFHEWLLVTVEPCITFGG